MKSAEQLPFVLKSASRVGKAALNAFGLPLQVLGYRLGLSKRDYTNERQPCAEYQLAKLLFAAIPAVSIETYLETIRAVDFEEVLEGDPGACSDNCIFFSFHGDTLPALAARRTLQELDSTWIGYHGLLSYVGSFGLASQGRPCFRFSLDSTTRPKHQIERALAASLSERFYMFTDSGGPYGRVKQSLVDLALSSGRPLVPVRHIASKRKVLNHHQVPLPNSRLLNLVGGEITVQTLLDVNPADRTQFLQMQMDRLTTGQSR